MVTLNKLFLDALEGIAMFALINATFSNGSATGYWHIDLLVCGRWVRRGQFASFEDAENLLAFTTDGDYILCESRQEAIAKMITNDVLATIENITNSFKPAGE